MKKKDRIKRIGDFLAEDIETDEIVIRLRLEGARSSDRILFREIQEVIQARKEMELSPEFEMMRRLERLREFRKELEQMHEIKDAVEVEKEINDLENRLRIHRMI